MQKAKYDIILTNYSTIRAFLIANSLVSKENKNFISNIIKRNEGYDEDDIDQDSISADVIN